MIEINDLYDMAKGFESSMQMLTDKSIDKSFNRGDIDIILKLNKENVYHLDTELHKAFTEYETEPYYVSDEINVKIWGINFYIVSKEKAQEEEETNN